MLLALIEGTTDLSSSPTSRSASCLKLPALREALQGRFDTQHAMIAGAILAHLDFLDERSTELSDGDRGPDRPFRQGG